MLYNNTYALITIITLSKGNYTKQLESILEIKSRIRYCLEKENEVKNNNDTSEQIITTTISPSVELKNPNYLHTVKIPLYKGTYRYIYMLSFHKTY